jgi:hypothetical protein
VTSLALKNRVIAEFYRGGAGLITLPAGERGWITLAEAARLFSTEEPQYAFGDFDEAGKTRLAQFTNQYRCTPNFIPPEGRLYFKKRYPVIS